MSLPDEYARDLLLDFDEVTTPLTAGIFLWLLANNVVIETSWLSALGERVTAEAV
jgi:hypothetical protein